MNDWECRKDPVYVSRDAGYSKIESISPENRRRAKEMMDDPNTVTRIDTLNKLYSKMGVIVHPERMTNWYAFTD
ncbi:hypothetical protein [uncultured Methanobrevibacter sp.]|uniref:hypothetical protein n=1 Tax=uncultured Methanobrevibacter sp. TaxID=253161 RepID=UPI00262A6B70|nr:hypothetical protein [uncultured Methanobrevibacter sp.]